MRAHHRPLGRTASGAVIALSFALAACGGNDAADDTPAPAETSSSSAAPTADPTGDPTSAPADEPTAEPDDPATSDVTESSESTTDESTGGAAADTVTIEHYSGTDTVPVDPQTVVVLDTGVLLTLDALGIEVDGFASLGVPTPERYAAVVEDPDLVQVGTAFEPDFEAINALDPDLIIVATRSSGTYPEMKKIAPTVDLTFDEGVDFMTTFADRHRAIGQIFGVEDEVEAALAEIDAEVARVGALTADAGSALIVMTSGTEVSAYGPGSRFGVVHDVLGYAAAEESLERDATHGDVVSFEFIAEAAPDVLFVIDRGSAVGEDGQLAEAVLDNELVRDTPAWQSGRVVYVDGYSWYIASNSIPAMRAIIADVEASVS